MRLLSLDFDGVLHPGNDPVFFNFKPTTPMFQIDLAMRTQKRFLWADRLAETLTGSDVQIVIHSTLRRRFSDRDLLHFLPEEIAHRVINLDDVISERVNLSADEYVVAAAEALEPVDLCVLDDRPEFFPADGLTAAWIEKHGGDFVWAKSMLGLSDLSTRERLSGWVNAALPQPHCLPIQH